MLEEFNALVKKFNDEKPSINMPDWSLRINTLNSDKTTIIDKTAVASSRPLGRG